MYVLVSCTFVAPYCGTSGPYDDGDANSQAGDVIVDANGDGDADGRGADYMASSWSRRWQWRVPSCLECSGWPWPQCCCAEDKTQPAKALKIIMFQFQSAMWLGEFEIGRYPMFNRQVCRWIKAAWCNCKWTMHCNNEQNWRTSLFLLTWSGHAFSTYLSAQKGWSWRWNGDGCPCD